VNDRSATAGGGTGGAGGAAFGAGGGAGGGDDALRVSVNGEARDLPAGTTVRGLLDALAVDLERCAVEINQEIVPRSTHATHVLRDGDAVEIVTFVGGG
jgi:sulfur carrier protein